MLIDYTQTASAQRIVEVELDHHCSLCGKTAAANVIGKGASTQRRSMFEFGGDVSSDAAFYAKDNAQRDAAALIRIAICPHCRRRDTVEVKRLVTAVVWPSVAVGVAIELLGYALGNDRTTLSDPLLFALIATGLTALALGGIAAKKWEGSTNRVRFLGVK